jgi:hypothetical protein
MKFLMAFLSSILLTSSAFALTCDKVIKAFENKTFKAVWQSGDGRESSTQIYEFLSAQSEHDSFGIDTIIPNIIYDLKGGKPVKAREMSLDLIGRPGSQSKCDIRIHNYESVYLFDMKISQKGKKIVLTEKTLKSSLTFIELDN